MTDKLDEDALLEQAGKQLYPLVSQELLSASTKKFNDEKWSLLDLHSWKQSDLPQLLKKRHDEDHAYLTKDELVLLMQWKLSVGKFRPTLPKLIDSNDSAKVEEATMDGFKYLLEFIDKNSPLLPEFQVVLRETLKKICVLRGVGPATASLILSLLIEITIYAPPFFSDECFMYMVRDSLRPGSPIKYNVKEYVDELIPVLYHVSERMKTPMEILQRGAWSLKQYQIFRISTLSDLKLPFEVSETQLECYKDTKDILENIAPTTAKKAGSVKRKAESTDLKKAAKRVSKK